MASAVHSVYPVGGMVSPRNKSPDFGLLSKPTATVDIGRLQNELRALHSRLELLETAALVAAAAEPETDVDRGGSGSAVTVNATAAVERIGEEAKNEEHRVSDQGLKGLAANADFEKETPPEGVADGHSNGRSKKAASVNAALQAHVHDMSERVEALAASAKRREKAQLAKEKAMALARSMEVNKMQLAIEARITSDDLEQAVGANSDKIVALQSGVDSALSDRFRRMQDMVQAQMAGLLNMVQQLTLQHGQSTVVSKTSRNSFTPARGLSSNAFGTDDDSDSDEDRNKAFVKAITEVVQKLLKEADKNGSKDMESAAFQALQEDYETFKGHMEEKADRQDSIASNLEDAQARLEEAEANIAALTREMETTAQEMQDSAELANKKQAQLDELARAASSLAADANGECAATRALVGESRREGLLEARQEAEAIAARAEGRVKAEVQKARGDARTATEGVGSELRRYIKTATGEAEAQKAVIAAARSLSDKAVAAAKSAGARATTGEASLEESEARLNLRLQEAVRNQTTSAETILERVATGEVALSQAEDELRIMIRENLGNLGLLKDEHAKLAQSSKCATEDLRTDVQDALAIMIVDQDFENGSGGAEGRAGTRSGGPGRGGDLDGGGKMGLASLGSTLRRQSDEMAQNVATLQRSGVGMVTVMRKVEAGLHALSTKDLFWQAVDAKLMAHQRAVGDVCLQVEVATVTRRTRITLSKEAQSCLAGDMQRVAKLVATKADYEVIRELAKLEGPEQTGQDWDERVEFLRQTQMRKFLKECREDVDKRAPEARTNFSGEEIRGKFLSKLSDSLMVALSKYAPTTPGATLFGKIKLKAKACVACDRPFTPSATGRPGPTPAGGVSGAAVEPSHLPDEHSHITKDAYRPQTSHGRLGSPSRPAPDLFEPQNTLIHSVISGGRSSPQSPHVYRGGFKLPKHLKSPLHAPDGEDHSPFGIGQAAPLLHKSSTMSGLNQGRPDGRPNTSGGTRSKGRPPSTPLQSRGGICLPSTVNGGSDEGSVASAFTMKSDVMMSKPGQGCGKKCIQNNDRRLRGDEDGDMTGFVEDAVGGVPQGDDDDTSCTRDSAAGHISHTGGIQPRPYFASAHDEHSRLGQQDEILHLFV